MSEQAKENLLRLSASITADLSGTRGFTYDGTKSRIRTTIRYQGQKKAKNFMLYESVPKTFASDASTVTVTAPGATVEIAESDPSWVILFPEVSPDQEITVTYEVTGMKSDSVIDSMTSEVYTESFEEIPVVDGAVCTANALRCSGNNLEECLSDGSAWVTKEACLYGCDSTALKCNDKPLVSPPSALDTGMMVMIGGVVALVIIIVVVVFIYMKKFNKATGSKSALESVKQDLGQ
jgi:hypothetical protein